jgi:hypothetical protein
MPDMIDFANGSVFKLSPCKTEEVAPEVVPLVVQGEQIVSALRLLATLPCSRISV